MNEKTSMSVREMGQMLGLKKVESYWLVHKNYFETRIICGKMRVMKESFEKWYRQQFHYKKVNGEPPGSDYAHTMSIKEFGELLGIPQSTAYWIVNSQQFEVEIINGRKQLKRQEVLTWMKEHPTYQKSMEQENEKQWRDQQRQFILTGEKNEVTPSKK